MTVNIGRALARRHESPYSSLCRALHANGRCSVRQLRSSLSASNMSVEHLFEKIDLDSFASRPDWYRESKRLSFQLKPVKNCSECARLLFHSNLFDLPWMDKCPVHRTELLSTCPNCTGTWPTIERVHLSECPVCGLAYDFGVSTLSGDDLAVFADIEERYLGPVSNTYYLTPIGRSESLPVYSVNPQDRGYANHLEAKPYFRGEKQWSSAELNGRHFRLTEIPGHLAERLLSFSMQRIHIPWAQQVEYAALNQILNHGGEINPVMSTIPKQNYDHILTKLHHPQFDETFCSVCMALNLWITYIENGGQYPESRQWRPTLLNIKPVSPFCVISRGRQYFLPSSTFQYSWYYLQLLKLFGTLLRRLNKLSCLTTAIDYSVDPHIPSVWITYSDIRALVGFDALSPEVFVCDNHPAGFEHTDGRLVRDAFDDFQEEKSRRRHRNIFEYLPKSYEAEYFCSMDYALFS